MNSALKWKLIAGFVLVFLAGGATGVFVSATTAHYFFGAHRHGFAAQAMKNRLQWQLRLTDEQMAKISPIIDKTAAQLRDIRRNTARRVHETIAEAHRQMAVNLTDEQRQKLQQIQERHRRRHHGHFHEHRAESPSPTP